MNLIERVARSLCTVGGEDPDDSAGWLLQPKRKLWENHVKEARIAIEAMRPKDSDPIPATGAGFTAKELLDGYFDAALAKEPANV